MLFDELKEYFEVPHEYYEFWIQDIDADGVGEVGLNIYDYTFLLHQTGEDVYAYKINGKAVQFVYADETIDGSGGWATKTRYQIVSFDERGYEEEKLFGNNYIYTEENLQKLTTKVEKR